MNEGERRFIYILIIIIGIASLTLIIKICQTKKYNPELHDSVYSEYKSVMNDSENTQENNNEESNTNVTYMVSGLSGEKSYRVAGRITIPKIKLVYPIVNETTDEYLKVAPTKLAGPEMNEIGNYCIAGHNYKYKEDDFFSEVKNLEKNDRVQLTSNTGKSLTYLVYSIYEVDENDTTCLDQNTNGKIEATLITCTTKKQNRLIVKCRAIEKKSE